MSHHPDEAQGEEWIQQVRVVITTLNPLITTPAIFDLFRASSDTMDLFHTSWKDGLTPLQTVSLLMRKYGAQIIGLDKPNPNAKPVIFPDRN